MKKLSISDEDFIKLSAEVGKSFPEDFQVALALYSAIVACEMFGDVPEEPQQRVYRRTCDKYAAGDFEFYDYTGGTLEEKHRVEYYKAGSFVDKQILPDKEEAFKYILAILSDYII